MHDSIRNQHCNPELDYRLTQWRGQWGVHSETLSDERVSSFSFYDVIYTQAPLLNPMMGEMRTTNGTCWSVYAVPPLLLQLLYHVD